jgi:hypothetical protein
MSKPTSYGPDAWIHHLPKETRERLAAKAAGKNTDEKPSLVSSDPIRNWWESTGLERSLPRDFDYSTVSFEPKSKTTFYFIEHYYKEILGRADERGVHWPRGGIRVRSCTPLQAHLLEFNSGYRRI